MNSLAKSLTLLAAGFVMGAGVMAIVPRVGEPSRSQSATPKAGVSRDFSGERAAFAAIAAADDESIEANYWTWMARNYAMIPWTSYGGEHVWGGGLRLSASKEHERRWDIEIDRSNRRELVGDRARIFVVGDGAAREVPLADPERQQGAILIVTPGCVRSIDLAEGSISQLGGGHDIPLDALKRRWTKARIDPAVMQRWGE
ncbi:MAG: hypothetical protein IT432_06620 [Phycisphaerales bacterium]|nr:hypothetical protein [Phycisphaerales bacterium]